MLTRKAWDHAIDLKERESVLLIKRSKRVHPEANKEEVYKNVKITTYGTSILCGEEGWKEENGVGLSISK